MMPNFRVTRDSKFNNLATQYRMGLPSFPTAATFPPPFIGGFVYNIELDDLYYSDGLSWKVVGAAPPPTSTSLFSYVKNGPLLIPPGPALVVNSWTDGLPYVSTADFDTLSGVYTASSQQYVNLNMNVEWSPNFSNQGSRTIRIRHFDFSTITTTTLYEAMCQPSADVAIPTHQSVGISAFLDIDDSLWVEVSQTSPVDVEVSTGVRTTVFGTVNPV